ncbi:MAG TPA: hypothetical protein VM534_06840 [Thermoanaerobaculia bacterium]|nr:hypothetical protein [Thermoanaerobaculia bacterium]
MQRPGPIASPLLVSGILLLLALGAPAQECLTPDAPAILFVPPGNVGVGQTYVIIWSPVENLDAGGEYLVERSADSAFSILLDSQRTSSTSASFVSFAETTAVYHRVKAIAGCDPTRQSAYSPARSVGIVSGRASVVFTVQPSPVITTLGDPLSSQKTSMIIENLAQGPATVAVIRQELGSDSFFTVVDPDEGDLGNLTLEPKTPKELEIHFSGVSNTSPDAYQGVVFLIGTPPLNITPYAFVNLKVGGGTTAAPSFRVGGVSTEYVFFPGFPSTSGDTGRAPISLDIHHPGNTSMELGAEIGPEVWLVPETGWNAQAIPPGSARTVRLFTSRSRAPTGSSLPRYTYFTIRSRSGQSARLLVQDNGTASLSSGRADALDPSVRSFIVPQFLSSTTNGHSIASKLRLSNLGADALIAELFFTPTGSDGFSNSVRQATVVVPPNDVVTLTDPLVQIFGIPPPASGQLEVRSTADRIGLLSVQSVASTPADGGGAFSYAVPVAHRGEGARTGSPHLITGISTTSGSTATLVLAETTGLDAATVRATLFDANGIQKGSQVISVPRYGRKEIASVVSALGGGTTIQGGRIDLQVTSGEGTVLGLAVLLDSSRGSAATLVSEPVTADLAKLQRLVAHQKMSWIQATPVQVALVIPIAVSGPISAGQSFDYHTLAGFTAPGPTAATFILTYYDMVRGGSSIKTLTVPAGRTTEFANVLTQLFEVPVSETSQGPIFIEADEGGKVYSRIVSTSSPGVATNVAAISPVSESTTSAVEGEQRPVYVDGLEQSVDPSRGTRWMLVIGEIGGAASSVNVRLYEAGNRKLPIAEKEFSLGPLGQMRLDSVFAAMDLETAERKKDRVDVLCVVTPRSGEGRVIATVIGIDNRTGDTQASILSPVGGIPASGISTAVIEPVDPKPSPKRRRTARRP